MEVTEINKTTVVMLRWIIAIFTVILVGILFFIFCTCLKKDKMDIDFISPDKPVIKIAEKFEIEEVRTIFADSSM